MQQCFPKSTRERTFTFSDPADTPLSPYTCPEIGGCEFNFILPLVINGIGLATYFSVVFAAVTVLVEKKLLGTAFGILDCF